MGNLFRGILQFQTQHTALGQGFADFALRGVGFLYIPASVWPLGTGTGTLQNWGSLVWLYHVVSNPEGLGFPDLVMFNIQGMGLIFGVYLGDLPKVNGHCLVRIVG